MEGCVMSFYADEVSDKHWQVYRMRKEDGATLREVGEAFGVTQERVRQMVARCERAIANVRAREAASAGSLGSLRLQRKMQRKLELQLLWKLEDWRDMQALDFMRACKFNDLRLLRSIGEKTLGPFCEELSKVVGDEAVARWRRGEQI
jgi:hypothetical protein